MSYANPEPCAAGWLHASSQVARGETRQVAILLFDGFSLLGAGTVAEVFHVANELSAAKARSELTYDVVFLSAQGGNVACSSSVRVWTDSVDAHCNPRFDSLFVAGGKGAYEAAANETLIAWLRAVHAKTASVKSIAEGRRVLLAAGIRSNQDPHGRFSAGALAFERNAWHAGAPGIDAQDESGDRYEPLKNALVMVKRDLGLEVARSVAERLLPGSAAKLEPLFGDGGCATAADKIHTAARWLQDNCGRTISVAEAAQVASMSERNFLRRFKTNMGVTPSDYLLQARLAVTCSLLTDSELPIDKIARRSGMGNGDRLAKIFRKRLLISPSEYRLKSRRSAATAP